jgi:uncharacterized protein YbbK (DUF523 family)
MKNLSGLFQHLKKNILNMDKLKQKTKKPVVGVSRCLLGDAVRYDGESKSNQVVIELFSSVFTLIPVCPEVEAGLSIPRAPVQLTGSIENPKLTGRDDPSVDVTGIMQSYCSAKPAELKALSGFIFKSRSPSCGLKTTPVFIDGECISETGTGVFSKSLCLTYPELPVINDSELKSQKQINQFVRAVKRYGCFRSVN